MHFDLLSPKDMSAIDALVKSYGGASEIDKNVRAMTEYDARQAKAAKLGFGDMLTEA